MATVPTVGADVGGTPVQFFFVGDSNTASERPWQHSASAVPWYPRSTVGRSLAVRYGTVRYPGSTAGQMAAAHVDGQ